MQPQILVGFDFSSASQKALVWAADLQRTTQGKSVHVIYVVNPLPVVAAAETAPSRCSLRKTLRPFAAR